MDADTGRSLAELIRKERIAHLGTLRGGAPLVSMTLFMAEQDLSAFYVHVSRLAWHTQDMLQDPRVALSIAETDDARPDPFTLMRVSIRGEASVNFELADFSFWRISPRDARFVAGFGRIHNLSAADLRTAEVT